MTFLLDEGRVNALRDDGGFCTISRSAGRRGRVNQSDAITAIGVALHDLGELVERGDGRALKPIR
jgi:hypothetical protein